jgi:hypothetical protein
MDLLRGLQKQLADLERRAVPRGIRAAEGFRNAGSPVASVRPLMNPVVATGLGGVGVAANLLSRGAIIPSLIEKTKEVFNPKDNIITTLRNFGTSVENQFVPPGQRRPYVGSSPTAVAANQNLNRGVIGSIPPSARGESYRRAELRLADAARPGGGGGGGGNAGYSVNTFTGSPGTGSPADRAYQQELYRTAQLTAQDPELQRYENARVAAKTQEEMNSVRDMGMEMWAKANPKLAAKVQPGQSGFDTIYKQTGQMPTPTFNPLMERTFPGMSRGAGEYTMGPSPLIPQVDPALNPAGPTYVLGEGPRLMNFSNEDVTPEMIKAYQEQLLKQAGAK